MTAASLLQVREEENSSALGTPLPLTDHALSVSMPTWRDNVGYMEQDRRVLDALLSGYPRFVVPLNVRKVSDFTVPPLHSLTRPIRHSRSCRESASRSSVHQANDAFSSRAARSQNSAPPSSPIALRKRAPPSLPISRTSLFQLLRTATIRFLTRNYTSSCSPKPPLALRDSFGCTQAPVYPPAAPPVASSSWERTP